MRTLGFATVGIKGSFSVAGGTVLADTGVQ